MSRGVRWALAYNAARARCRARDDADPLFCTRAGARFVAVVTRAAVSLFHLEGGVSSRVVLMMACVCVRVVGLQRVGEMMRQLKYVRGLEFAAGVGYVDFLSRVNRVEDEARRNGSWAAPHPWLNLFISSRDIAAFDRAVLNGMLADGVDGPMLIYPMLKSK